MRFPGAFDLNHLTGTDTCQIADHGDHGCQIRQLQAGNRIVGRLIKVGNPLKMPLESKQGGTIKVLK